MKYTEYEQILSRVEKPSRYVGGEMNSVQKDLSQCKLSFALAFPDVYEVAMSHLGIQILYALLNSDPDIAAERFFAPWPDLEGRMREARIPLLSHESRIPLAQFDVVGFSLQYELSYTNVLTMLDLGGIALRAANRDDNAPIVIAGGPCVFNSAPMAPFFDAFAIGEGEEIVLEIARTVIEGKEKGQKRVDMLTNLAAIEGVYVPTVHTGNDRIKKRIVADINRHTLPSNPIVPLTKIIHDRITLEIARGCTRGCRFCQPGMVWRPTRERTPDTLMEMADTMLAATGHDEISLLSLSSGDYSRIEYLLSALMNRYYEDRIALALPSLRVETLTPRVIDEIKRVRKTSFTLAPEAGTQRLRNVINKGNTEENLLDTVRRVFDAGWRSVKLYFMIGLPTETAEDIEGIADLAYRVLREGGKRRQVTISVSTFIPKPHTPFQWSRQIGLDETSQKQDYLKKTIRHRNLNLRWHDARMSLLEGILSRGDERVSELVARAFALGCRFDGWGDQLQFTLWEQALSASAISPDTYLRERSVGEALPWDRIDPGIDREFLAEEYAKSLREELTEDCRFGKCSKCGVCTTEYKVILAGKEDREDFAEKAAPAVALDPQHTDRTLRIKFAKRGNARWLSHLETSSALMRGMKRCGVAFVFSDGFHPHPKISFSSATPVGVESTCEYADVRINNSPVDIQNFIKSIRLFLPTGIEIEDVKEIAPHEVPLSKAITGYHYEIHLPKRIDDSSLDQIETEARQFIATDVFMVARNRKGKRSEKNVRPFVNTVTIDREENIIHISSHITPQGGINPVEILRTVLKLSDEIIDEAHIVKTKSVFYQRTQ